MKVAFKCDESFKKKFSSSKCLLTISVGQEAHEGDKFAVTIDLVNKHFVECTIGANDSLQRYSMALMYGKTAEEMYDDAIIAGDKWLERNKELYSRLTIPYKIVRWDEWLNHPEYQEKLEAVINFYNINNEYKAMIDGSIEEFLFRYRRRLASGSDFDDKFAFETCRSYLFEECAALCLWKYLGSNFEIYPSKRNSAVDATHKSFVLPETPDLLHPVRLKFKKNFKAQNFAVSEKSYMAG